MKRNRNNLLSLAEQSFKPLEKTIEGKLVGGFTEIVNNCDCIVNNCNCTITTTASPVEGGGSIGGGGITTTTTTTKSPNWAINMNCP
ncbi:MAG: hypothetical protein J6C18_01955 [Bacteroidaceae bacterium]|nr:hypothetical protein [Bacteroidaceae bacterium]